MFLTRLLYRMSRYFLASGEASLYTTFFHITYQRLRTDSSPPLLSRNSSGYFLSRPSSRIIIASSEMENLRQLLNYIIITLFVYKFFA